MTTLRAATLTDIRVDAGLSPTEAAKRMRVPRSTLHRAEQGTNPPEIRTLQAFALALGGHLDLVIRIPGKDPVLLALPSKEDTADAAE